MVEQKQKNLNFRVSESEKNNLDERAKTAGMKLSDYVRSVLFSKEEQSKTADEQRNTDEVQRLETELVAKNNQIETLHKLLENQQTLLLNSQNENKLLLEHDSKKSWWQFWK